ncbi:hypothetical protein [Frigidibacter mobilis]|uniref:Uncharacterized protein n=1 Tax=Frigidibacter mobilis TaxID=1335048 RepID=A0A159Z3P7_9RHOB|nr:hypothetical protein [Frigidibacter mobilis]AMY69752.1 hypothetical protein AKL17_2508 [Frigidibacter mobilis]
MTEDDLPQVGLPEAGKETSPIVETPPAGEDEGTRELCYFNGSWGILGSC